jgi:hypothetical protein
MQTERVTFHSDQLKLSGVFFLPDDFDASSPQPLVIPCSGFTGLCEIHPARFARYLTGRGYACFGFDYRGFAESEGQRGRVILEEQVRDIRHAVGFAAGDDRFDASRFVLLGWGMGGGLVLDAARELSHVAGLIAVNGFYVGKRVQLAHRGHEGYGKFVEEVDAERSQRCRTGDANRVDPFHIYPLDPQSREYVDTELRKHADYDTEQYSMELADSLIAWRPEAQADRMEIPLLIAHGEANRLHPPGEAEMLLDAWGGPKELFWVPQAGHTEWMLDEHPKFQELGGKIADWLDRLFGKA